MVCPDGREIRPEQNVSLNNRLKSRLLKHSIGLIDPPKIAQRGEDSVPGARIIGRGALERLDCFVDLRGGAVEPSSDQLAVWSHVRIARVADSRQQLQRRPRIAVAELESEVGEVDGGIVRPFLASLGNVRFRLRKLSGINEREDIL